MHGFVHLMLKQFVLSVGGEEGWQGILKDAGLKSRVYSSTGAYPDEEVLAIVQTASQKLGKPIPDILVSFGEFIAPRLLENFASLVNPSWGLFEFLENTERQIHEVIRTRDPNAAPPKLGTTRVSPQEMHVSYESNRGLLPVGKGIILGLANHYKIPVSITELPGNKGLRVVLN